MRKNKYIMPSIEIAEMDAEELLQTISGGGDDGGYGSGDAKQNSIFAAFDTDYDANWGDVWADEMNEEY